MRDINTILEEIDFILKKTLMSIERLEERERKRDQDKIQHYKEKQANEAVSTKRD